MVNIDDIPVVEPQQLFDPSKFDGTKVKIAEVNQTEFPTHYINGEWNQNETVDAPVIEVVTEKLDTIKTKDGEKDIVVTHRFNLQTRENEDGTTEIVISKNPNALLWKFLRKMGCTKPSELVGKVVTITTQPDRDPNSDRLWLRILI